MQLELLTDESELVDGKHLPNCQAIVDNKPHDIRNQYWVPMLHFR